MMPHLSLMKVLMFCTYSASVPSGDGRFLTVMLGSAVTAACMPSHADWLNDRSLIVPSSATMQARNLAEVEAFEPDEEVVAGLDEPLDDGAELLLLPHAATTSVADTASAAVAHALCFTLPPHGLAASKPPAWNHLG